MIFSPNRIIGSLVYRTREALNADKAFMELVSSYYYAPNCLVNGKFSLWHFPGTHAEISGVLLKLGEAVNGSRLKFPAILNFQSIRQAKTEKNDTIYYNLAVVGSVKSDWMTETREVEVFDKVLRPIYDEFMRQIQLCTYFQLGYGMPSHDYYEVFTTGGNSAQLKDVYGDHIDAVELHNLSLKLRPTLCKKDADKIDEENQLVTSNIKDLLL